MQLSPHFSYEALVDSDTATWLGIDNTPPDEIKARLVTLAAGLERVRLVLNAPMLIKSGYRCEALEKVLCAKDYAAWCGRRKLTPGPAAWARYFSTKAHPKGWAADFIAPAYGPPAAVVKAVVKAGLVVDQIIAEGRWCHVSFDPQMRGQVLTASFSADGTPTYTQGA